MVSRFGFICHHFSMNVRIRVIIVWSFKHVLHGQRMCARCALVSGRKKKYFFFMFCSNAILIKSLRILHYVFFFFFPFLCLFLVFLSLSLPLRHFSPLRFIFGLWNEWIIFFRLFARSELLSLMNKSHRIPIQTWIFNEFKLNFLNDYKCVR